MKCDTSQTTASKGKRLTSHSEALWFVLDCIVIHVFNAWWRFPFDIHSFCTCLFTLTIHPSIHLPCLYMHTHDFWTHDLSYPQEMLLYISSVAHTMKKWQRQRYAHKLHAKTWWMRCVKSNRKTHIFICSHIHTHTLVWYTPESLMDIRQMEWLMKKAL